MSLTRKERFIIWIHTVPRTPASRFVYMLYEVWGCLYRWWHKIDSPDDRPF